MVAVTKVGSQILINSVTAGNQIRPELETLTNGNFVAVWEDESGSDGDRSAVKAQLFDSAGTKLGGEFLVNTATEGAQSYPSVTNLPGGGFVVSWQGSAGDPSGWGVKAQIFSATGDKIGAEFLVNTQTASAQWHPEVASLPNGFPAAFVAVWEDLSGTLGDSSGSSIKGQVFTSLGDKAGSEFLINTSTAGNQQAPVVSNYFSSFMVAWQDENADGSGFGIKGQAFNSFGDKVGSEFLINTNTAGGQVSPAIATLSTGGYVVTWQDGQDIKAQILNTTGGKIGSEFEVNHPRFETQASPSIAALDSGNFVISWHDYSVSGGNSSVPTLKLQVFDNQGHKLGGELLVPSPTGFQSDPTITNIGHGRFIVAWEDLGNPGADTSGDSVKAQIFDVNNDPMIVSPSGDSTAALNVAENTTGVTTIHATDADGDAITYSISGGADSGRFSIDPHTGQLSFNVPPDFENPTDAGRNNIYDVVVRASDGTLFDTISVAVTVTNVNEAPVADADGPYAGTEDTQLVVNAAQGVLAGDRDPEGAPLTAVLVSGPEHGDFVLNPDGSFTYKPDANFHGPDHFVYHPTDGVLNGPDQTIVIDVASVNDNPVATDDVGFSTAFDTARSFSQKQLLTNDTDVDGDPLSISAVGNAVGGTVALGPNGVVVFTPTTGRAGPASFDYTVSDGHGGFDIGHVLLSVAEAPNAGGPPVIRGEDGDSVLKSLPDGGALYGQGGNDTLIGDKGNDWLVGGAGNDLMHGGSGADQFRFSGSDIEGGVDRDTIVDFDPVSGDRLVFNHFGTGTFGAASVGGLQVIGGGTAAIVDSYADLAQLAKLGNVTAREVGAGSDALEIDIRDAADGDIQQIVLHHAWTAYLAAGGQQDLLFA